MVRGGEDVRDAEKLADSSEEFLGELLSVIRDQRLRWSIFKDPCFHERNGNRISVNPSEGHDLSQLREAFRHHEEKSVTFLGLRPRSEDIDCQGFEGSSRRKYLKGMRPFPELHPVLRAGRTVTVLFVYIGGHLRPLTRLTEISVHAGLSGGAGQYRVVSEVEHTRSERIG